MQSNRPNKQALTRARAFVSDIVRTPKKLAIAIAILLLFWLVVVGDHKQSKSDAPDENKAAANSVNLVQVQSSEASPWQQAIVLQGQVLPWRTVTIKAEVTGTVLEINKNQGEQVAQGEVLLTLSDEGRTAMLDQAKADLEYSKLELESAKTLQSSKFVSDTELSRFKAALAGAEAKLETAQLAASYGKPKAPFTGTIDRRHVEIGDQVNPDAPLVDIVQINKLKVTAYVPQQKIVSLTEGQQVELTLLNGAKLPGVLSFISLAADEATRSYYIEVTVENPERLRIAGASATISIPVEPILSHTVSPALLHLDENGKPGVYTVNNNDVVEYFQVDILSVGSNAVIAGLPDTARLITIGSGFVKVGQSVTVSEPGQ